MTATIPTLPPDEATVPEGYRRFDGPVPFLVRDPRPLPAAGLSWPEPPAAARPAPPEDWRDLAGWPGHQFDPGRMRLRRWAVDAGCMAEVRPQKDPAGQRRWRLQVGRRILLVTDAEVLALAGVATADTTPRRLAPARPPGPDRTPLAGWRPVPGYDGYEFDATSDQLRSWRKNFGAGRAAVPRLMAAERSRGGFRFRIYVEGRDEYLPLWRLRKLVARVAPIPESEVA